MPCCDDNIRESPVSRSQEIQGGQPIQLVLPAMDDVVDETEGSFTPRNLSKRIDQEGESGAFPRNNLNSFGVTWSSEFQWRDFSEMEDQSVERKEIEVQETPQGNSGDHDTRDHKRQLSRRSSLKNGTQACAAVVDGNVGRSGKEETNSSAGNPRRWRGNLRLSKLKWATVEDEKPKRVFLKKGQSSRSVADREEAGAASLQPQKQRAVSFDEDFFDDVSGNPEAMELSWNKFDKKNVRRGSTCEEIEKTIFYQGYNLHKLRKAIVVRETLQERFTF